MPIELFFSIVLSKYSIEFLYIKASLFKKTKYFIFENFEDILHDLIKNIFSLL